MKRIALTNALGYWFDEDRATSFSELTYWNGRNWISKATNSQFEHEELLCTHQGMWILKSWTDYQGSVVSYCQVADKDAAIWLISMGCELPSVLEHYYEDFEL